MAYYTFTKDQYKSMPSAQSSSLGIKKKKVDGEYVYYTTKSAATKYGGTQVDYNPTKSQTSSTSTSSSSGTTSTITSSPTTTTNTMTPYEAAQVYMSTGKLPEGYDPGAAPTAARLDEIANQSFITPEVKAAYTTSKLQPVNQDYMAATYNASLPTTTLSTDASKIPSPYQDVALGTPTIGTGNIDQAWAGTTSLNTLSLEQQRIDQERLDRQLAQNEENKSMLQQLMSSMTSPGEARQNAWDETGIDVQEHFAQQQAGFKEIETLTNEYNKTMMMKDQQIAQTHDRLASNNFINNQIAQIERNAAPKLNRLSADINAKAAVLQALQGNFAEAQKYVNQAVQDATAENKFKYDMFSMAFELNNNAFDRIEAIYSDAYKSQMAIAQMQYEEQKAEKEQIGNLLLQYPNAGIDIYNDSLQEALEKAGIRAGSLEYQQLTSGGSGGSSLTASQKEYLFAVQQGYEGSYAEWEGKTGGGDTSTVDTYALGLFSGDLSITNVPEKYRDKALAKYYQMQQVAAEQSLVEIENTTSDSWLTNALTKPNPIPVTTPQTRGVTQPVTTSNTVNNNVVFGIPEADAFYSSLGW